MGCEQAWVTSQLNPSRSSRFSAKKVFLASSHPGTKRASGARQRQAKTHRRGNRQNVCLNGGQRTEIGLARPSTPPQGIWRLRRNEWPHNLKLAWDSSRLLEMQPSLLTAGINSRGLTNLARQLNYHVTPRRAPRTMLRGSTRLQTEVSSLKTSTTTKSWSMRETAPS